MVIYTNKNGLCRFIFIEKKFIILYNVDILRVGDKVEKMV